MNKIVLTTSLLLTYFAAPLFSQDKATKSNLSDQFEQLSEQSIALQSKNNIRLDESIESVALSMQANPFDTPSVFIEQELADSLANLKEVPASLIDNEGQWSVSFDLNQLAVSQSEWNLAPPSTLLNESLDYDWQLGTSLVSPDKTSRFYVNYGNRKLPISISFDEAPTNTSSISQDVLALGFEQSINESWAVSISYLKTENQFSNVVNRNEISQSVRELNYLFDFNPTNRLETVNFSPFSQNLNQTNFMDDISAIQIKVSRRITDDLMFSAKASQQQSGLTSELAQNSLFRSGVSSLQSQELALQGNYRLTDNWSLDADIEHQLQQFDNSLVTSSDNLNQLDSTTLDIGVQYQSNWEQVGVVIRIDLMNLLGASNAADNLIGLDNNGLKPFSFDTPKYIKVTGSINF